MSTAVKTKRGLLGNAFRSDRWNSRISTANVTPKEMWLGYVIGPYGMLVVQSIVNSYYNQYMTDVRRGDQHCHVQDHRLHGLPAG